ncbi:ABC transporter substrate-binding protein [Arthrobacter flavus]|uniref:ABC transporter substrate-binding protein n=1 Tax=Arthrobacter flavus TaxID=95172 RepID=A0ABW4Q4T5_9MICC
MPQPVDVGSVLGGRYKVTAYVLASADRDLVLDGMDQVLNRPVSILVASASNAGQIAATAREVATGERAGNIQVLDLGVTDESTYLVTNRASPADLLDLVVPQDAPFVEPFFTDTLGSEIFGGPRSTEPETYDDDYDDDDDDQPEKKARLPKARLPKFGKGAAAAGAGVTAGAADGGPAPTSANPTSASSAVPPAPDSAPRVEDQPKVSLWSDSDYNADATRADDSGRAASHFPAAAASGGKAPDEYDEYDPAEDNDEGNNPKYTRVLVGVVLAIILVTVVALSVNQLSNYFSPDPLAGTDTTQVAEEPSDDVATTPAEGPEENPEPTVEAVEPVAANVTRLVPDNPELNAETDADLPLIIDGNPGSFWGSLVYANETFGGLAQNMALVVELEEESTISQIQIEQLNGSGGSFTVLLNDEPTLEGADQIAQSSFTGPTINIPVPPSAADQPATAQYIIVNLTQLPRLTNVQAVFPWGVRIAEISVS